MYGFEESENTRRQKLPNNKIEKKNLFVRIKSKGLFEIADQEKFTYGSYILTSKGNNIIDALIRDNGVDKTKIVIKDIGW